MRSVPDWPMKSSSKGITCPGLASAWRGGPMSVAREGAKGVGPFCGGLVGEADGLGGGGEGDAEGPEL